MRYLTILTMFFVLLSGTNVGADIAIKTASTQVQGSDVQVRYFYPTVDQADVVELGPWAFDAALNGRPAAGDFPVVIISHGFAANLYSHHDLAQMLAHNGMVAVTVQHANDIFRVGTAEHLVLRPQEISAALDMVLSDPTLAPHVDAKNIGAFGFSLGGYTVLAAAGGMASFQRAQDHCANPQKDAGFCLATGGEDLRDFALMLRDLLAPPPAIDLAANVHDPRIKAIAVAAPVGAPFSSLDNVRVPTLLYRAGRDGVLRYPYHAERVHKLLPKGHVYRVRPDVGHLSFMSEIPEAMKAFVAAEDLHGPKQAAFLKTFNTEITSFFIRHLAN